MGEMVVVVVVLFLKQLLFVQKEMTALHIAADKGFERIVKIFTEHSSNIDARDWVLIFFPFICFSYFLFVCVVISNFDVIERVRWLGGDLFCSFLNSFLLRMERLLFT